MNISLITSILPVDFNRSEPIQFSSQNDQKRLEKACQDFEVLFTSTFLSEMVNSINIQSKSGVSQMQENWVWNMMFQTIAQDLSQTESLGLGKMLFEQFGIAEKTT